MTRHRRHANPFAFRGDIARPDYATIFGRAAPLEVEIGFGKGQFLRRLAAARPDTNFVGLEIRQFLVDGLMEDARADGLGNVHGVYCNANTALTALFVPGEVRRFYVNFPDPWFKKRHVKRRVINAETATMIRELLATEGEVHVMTDYEPIALDMREALELAGLVNVAGRGNLMSFSTTGVTSEREDWHLSQGDPVHRFMFRRH